MDRTGDSLPRPGDTLKGYCDHYLEGPVITANEDGFAMLLEERARILDDFAHHTATTLEPMEGVLADSIAYVLATPGKLLRPLLLLDACRAAGGDPTIAFPAAAGTECGHIASLVHDDIIDGDGERRGQETLHTKYDAATAILSGDLLIFQMFLSYTECHERGASAEAVLAAMRTLSATCIEVCRGQALEASAVGDLETSEETYLEIIRLKTSSVCRAATRIGALLAGAPDEVTEALGLFGHNLGMAFQIIDDVLAYDGHAELVGKPLESDLHNRRVTLPIIYALQAATPRQRREILMLFEGNQGSQGNGARANVGIEARKQLVHILTATRAVDRARARAYGYSMAAKAQLAGLPPSEARERLYSLADMLLSRDH